MMQKQSGTGPNYSLSLTSLFDDLEAAKGAAERLKAAGVAQSSISLITGGGKTAKTEQEHESLLSKLENFLFPEADHAEYSEGIRRGGHVLAVSGLSVERYDQAIAILNEAGAVDLDARTESWRTEGWDGSPRVIKEPKDIPAIIDKDVAASLIESGRGDELVTIVTEKLPFGQRSDKSGPRVRVYTVEHAWKDTQF